MSSTRYVSCTETAKLIRQLLKREFPSVKFSVRSHQYAGGASIDIDWADGPSSHDVEMFVKPFEGKAFDGMIDLAVHKDHYLLPDGTAALAEHPGTDSSAGTIPRDRRFKPHPDAERVRFGADYVFCQRRLSEAYIETCRNAWEALDAGERCDLLNRVDFPRWPEDDPGQRLAAFVGTVQPKSKAA